MSAISWSTSHGCCHIIMYSVLTYNKFHNDAIMVDMSAADKVSRTQHFTSSVRVTMRSDFILALVN